MVEKSVVGLVIAVASTLSLSACSSDGGEPSGSLAANGGAAVALGAAGAAASAQAGSPALTVAGASSGGAGSEAGTLSGSAAGGEIVSANGGGGGAPTAGGSASGGAASGAPSGGAAGQPSGGGAGASTGPAPWVNVAFSQCRFHFGTIDSQAKNNSKLIPELDFFTPGWVGQSDKFDMDSVCGAGDKALANAVPVLVSYIIAFTARRDAKLQDCNVSSATNLCTGGATFIRAHRDRILAQYKMYAQGFATSCGTKRPLIWEMEPDYYQYSVGGDPQALSATEAGALMTELITTVQQYLPNAAFSLDISPWIPNNGKDWYSHFDLSKVSFINTSGGGTSANSTKVRSTNAMTWAGVHQVTGKPILADTGYGVAGQSAGHDAQWDDVSNINARIADGVIGISQYNPKSDWATTMQQARGKIAALGCK